jgi:hypothetical protein
VTLVAASMFRLSVRSIGSRVLFEDTSFSRLGGRNCYRYATLLPCGLNSSIFVIPCSITPEGTHVPARCSGLLSPPYPHFAETSASDGGFGIRVGRGKETRLGGSRDGESLRRENMEQIKITFSVYLVFLLPKISIIC